MMSGLEGRMNLKDISICASHVLSSSRDFSLASRCDTEGPLQPAPAHALSVKLNSFYLPQTNSEIWQKYTS